MTAKTTDAPAWAQSLIAELAELRALVSAGPAKPASKTRPRTFATKAERMAGNGFPCTAEPNCGRTNLRTPNSGASHDSTQPHYHVPAA